MKKNVTIFGILVLSALLILILGSFVPFTQVLVSDDVRVEGPFAQFLPVSDHPVEPYFTLIEILSYWMGFDTSKAWFLGCGTVGASLIAALPLAFGDGLRRSALRSLRYVVLVVYCGAPVLAGAISLMFLYALAAHSA